MKKNPIKKYFRPTKIFDQKNFDQKFSDFFRRKIFRPKFFGSLIPIPNFPKIPKIVLRTACDHFKNTKTLPEDKYLKRVQFFWRNEQMVQSPYLRGVHWTFLWCWEPAQKFPYGSHLVPIWFPAAVLGTTEFSTPDSVPIWFPYGPSRFPFGSQHWCWEPSEFWFPAVPISAPISQHWCWEREAGSVPIWTFLWCWELWPWCWDSRQRW